MSVGRAFLPVPRGDSRFYLGSQQCEGLLAQINNDLARLKIPYMGSGVHSWSSGVIVDLPESLHVHPDRSSVTIAFEVAEGSKLIYNGGKIIRSETPISTIQIERQGDSSEAIIWKGLLLCLVDIRDPQDTKMGIHEVSHNGRILVRTRMAPGEYRPQFILPPSGGI